MTPDIPANAPWCAAADPDTRRPRIVMPRHACDTHAHVCGPFAQYAYAAERLYTPPDETWPMYRRMLDALGVDRAVLTQPSVYGTDNSALVDALAAEELPYTDITPMAHALVAAAPQRLLWGTDWPHVMMKKQMPNDADIADPLLDWVPSEAHRQSILVDNPRTLYGFPAA